MVIKSIKWSNCIAPSNWYRTSQMMVSLLSLKIPKV